MAVRTIKNNTNMSNETSTKAELTLTFVQDFIETNGYAPTVREIAVGCGVSTAVAHYRLERLRDAGAVTWTPGTARTLRVAP